jgi:hypothetical protein
MHPPTGLPPDQPIVQIYKDENGKSSDQKAVLKLGDQTWHIELLEEGKASDLHCKIEEIQNLFNEIFTGTSKENQDLAAALKSLQPQKNLDIKETKPTAPDSSPDTSIKADHPIRVIDWSTQDNTPHPIENPEIHKIWDRLFPSAGADGSDGGGEKGTIGDRDRNAAAIGGLANIRDKFLLRTALQTWRGLTPSQEGGNPPLRAGISQTSSEKVSSPLTPHIDSSGPIHVPLHTGVMSSLPAQIDPPIIPLSGSKPRLEIPNASGAFTLTSEGGRASWALGSTLSCRRPLIRPTMVFWSFPGTHASPRFSLPNGGNNRFSYIQGLLFDPTRLFSHSCTPQGVSKQANFWFNPAISRALPSAISMDGLLPLLLGNALVKDTAHTRNIEPSFGLYLPWHKIHTPNQSRGVGFRTHLLPQADSTGVDYSVLMQRMSRCPEVGKKGLPVVRGPTGFPVLRGPTGFFLTLATNVLAQAVPILLKGATPFPRDPATFTAAPLAITMPPLSVTEVNALKVADPKVSEKLQKKSPTGQLWRL